MNTDLSYISLLLNSWIAFIFKSSATVFMCQLSTKNNVRTLYRTAWWPLIYIHTNDFHAWTTTIIWIFFTNVPLRIWREQFLFIYKPQGLKSYDIKSTADLKYGSMTFGNSLVKGWIREKTNAYSNNAIFCRHVGQWSIWVNILFTPERCGVRY